MPRFGWWAAAFLALLVPVLVLPVAVRRDEGGPVGDGPIGDGPIGDGPVGDGPVGDGPVGGVPAASPQRGAGDRVVGLPGNAGARGLALAPDGTLRVARGEVGGVARIDPDGTVTQRRVSAGADMVHGIARATDGAVWFTTGELVGYLAPTGALTRRRAGSPQGITVGPDAAAWFTTSAAGAPAIGRAEASGRDPTTTVLPDGTRFPADGITAGPDQALWFTQIADATGGPDRIGRLDATGAYTSRPLPPATVPQHSTAQHGRSGRGPLVHPAGRHRAYHRGRAALVLPGGAV